MLRTFFITIFALFLFSCQDEIIAPEGYPTQVNPLSQIAFNKLLGQVNQTSMNQCLSIDTLGFLIITSSNENCIDFDNWRYDATEEEIITDAKEAILEFGSFVNVKDTTSISFNNVTSLNGTSYASFKTSNPDSVLPVWMASSLPQTYNDLTVRGSNISVLLSPYGAIALSGYWYEEVFIPETNNYSEDQAKELITNKQIEDGKYEYIPNQNTNWYNSEKIILPIRRSYSIELRVCWAIRPENWEVLIDTQTGEILSTIYVEGV